MLDEEEVELVMNLRKVGTLAFFHHQFKRLKVIKEAPVEGEVGLKKVRV